MQPAPHVLPGWGPHEGGNGSRDAPGRGPTGTRRERRKAGLMRGRAARVGPPPGREVCVPSAPARGQTHPGLPTPEGRSPSTQRGDGGAVWAASDWRSRREGRRPGLGSARSAQPGLPARWGGGAARPGSGRLPRPGPRGYLGPADAQRELGLRAGGRHCGSEGGRRRGVWGSAAATPARGVKLGVPAGARPGPACGSGGRGGRKCSGVRALRSHGLSPASPSTGRTAGRGARGRRRGPVKGTARRASARALAARWTPGRVVPGRGRGVGWARGSRTRGSRAWWAAAAPRLP